MEMPKTLASAAKMLKLGQISSRELTQHFLRVIAQRDGDIQAFLTVQAEEALHMTDAADLALRANTPVSPLCGIPIALKDLYATQNLRTTAGSHVLAENIPLRDASLVSKLRDQNAVLLGKTNTHEFAWGTFTPPTKNPRSLAKISGGSSGGSAAAVAAGMCLAALGTDTGGSIRIPASFCGVTGFKPTFGALATQGIIELSASLDHAGPIAWTAEDCAILFHELAGRTPEPDFYSDDLPPIRIAILGGIWQTLAEDAIYRAVQSAALQFEEHISAKHIHIETLQPVQEDDLNELLKTYRIIQGFEAAAYHRRNGWYPQQKAKYTAMTLEYLERAVEITAAEYAAALEARRVFVEHWNTVTARYDILLAPTMAISPPDIAETEQIPRRNELSRIQLSFTFPLNMCGVPALTVPCNTSENGLPIGLQIIGRRNHDDLTLRVGRIFQNYNNYSPNPVFTAY